jgi:hypothetical protein
LPDDEARVNHLSTLDFSHVEDDRVRDLVAFWLAARGEGLLPTVDKIDPLEFHAALSNVWLCDVIDGNPWGRWRYRLIGDDGRRAYGRNIVGETLESVTEAPAVARVTRYFAIATDWPAVVHVGGRVYSEAEYPARGERIILPFLDAATGRVGRLLGATVHSWLERGYPMGSVPLVQTRTYTPVDGTEATGESSE